METNYSAGPWYSEGDEGGAFVITDPRGYALCTRSPWPSNADESNANATLIASAPELVEALKPFSRLADAMSEQTPDIKADGRVVWGYNDADLTYGDFRRALAALSKAGVS